jgi:hypothetical protein
VLDELEYDLEVGRLIEDLAEREGGVFSPDDEESLGSSSKKLPYFPDDDDDKDDDEDDDEEVEDGITGKSH